MFRTIVTTALLIEGGLFFSAGLSPDLRQILEDTLSRSAGAIAPAQFEGIVALFAILQKALMGFGLLCIAGGWGALQGKAWGRWTAVAASAGNLLVFFPLGVAGLILFLRPQTETEPGGKPKMEAAEPVSHLVVMVFSLALVVYFSHWIRNFGAARGLPADLGEGLDLPWLLAGQLAFTLFHEIGHLVAAWAAGFQFHEINVGPFTLTERPGGSWAFRFDYRHILMAGGYLHAVPRSLKDLRLNWILVVAAGPAASLFVAMMGFLTLVSLPGTPFADYWSWAAFVTAICAADCLANLLPLGQSDGALLLHTALGTRRGKGMLAGLEAAMLNDRVDRSVGMMDPVELLETRRQALVHVENNSTVPPLAVAAQKLEFAQASIRNGRAEEAARALADAVKLMESTSNVPDLLWFRYWVELYETATARRHFTSAANAREKALELAGKLDEEKPDWETLVAVRLECVRLKISDGDINGAVETIRETRAACPARGSLTPYAAELLAVEGECVLRLGRRAEASALTASAIEIAEALTGEQRVMALELLAHTAVRLSAAGDYDFAQPLFESAVEGIEKAATGAVPAGYRLAWAEALYESGKLDKSQAVLAPLDSGAVGFAIDIETLRAQLLLAEDRPADAVAALNPVLAAAAGDTNEIRLAGLARIRALRAWALYRSGAVDDGMKEAREACDILMPSENPDAAPALLTLAMAVEPENSALAEAYVDEGCRLIRDSDALSPLTKASRLTDMARGAVQANHTAWGRRLMEQAAKERAQHSRRTNYVGATAQADTSLST